MKPNTKAPEIDELLVDTFGVDRVTAIETNMCAWCGRPAEKFDNELSVKEYTISGMCQICQNDAFAPDDD